MFKGFHICQSTLSPIVTLFSRVLLSSLQTRKFGSQKVIGPSNFHNQEFRGNNQTRTEDSQCLLQCLSYRFQVSVNTEQRVDETTILSEMHAFFICSSTVRLSDDYLLSTIQLFPTSSATHYLFKLINLVIIKIQNHNMPEN